MTDEGTVFLPAMLFRQDIEPLELRPVWVLRDTDEAESSSGEEEGVPEGLNVDRIFICSLHEVTTDTGIEVGMCLGKGN